MWPEFHSWTRRCMWVEFVVGSFLALRGFSLGTPVFPSPQKPTFLNSNWIRNSMATGLSVTRLLHMYVLPSLNKVDLFIYLFIHLFKGKYAWLDMHTCFPDYQARNTNDLSCCLELYLSSVTLNEALLIAAHGFLHKLLITGFLFLLAFLGVHGLIHYGFRLSWAEFTMVKGRNFFQSNYLVIHNSIFTHPRSLLSCAPPHPISLYNQNHIQCM